MLFLKYSCFREAANQKKAGLKETLVEFKLKKMELKIVTIGPV